MPEEALHMPVSEGLGRFNALPRREAEAVLARCCASARWAAEVARGRPYPSLAAVHAASDAALARLDECDVDEAMAGHARIGEPATGADGAWSRREQSRVATATDDVRAALAEGNRVYEARFGHVYLVCASGRDAEELLALLRERLDNDPVTERRVLRQELAAINRVRLDRLLDETEACS